MLLTNRIGALMNRVHARVGDLWWYSAMIFVACRSGDAINAFIGLWLVPKYVGPQELGAVLLLQQLTSVLTVPLGVVAIVFSKQVNTYAVFLDSIMPFFYERLKIASGLLTALILASGFVGSIGSLVGAAQQGLKREIFSGYILGQTTPGVVTTTLAALDTKKAPAPYAPNISWRKDWKSILGYTWPIAA